ncbi:MAG: Eco57I restriction-modification methylase domain-containing protein [Smithellaceae bacterium]|nr:Eco57I restriction-modification methylase domain-containing protein [Smithellaceae bacterium]
MSTESLSVLDHVRQSYIELTNRSDRFQIGQFLTPSSIAVFMSSLFQGATKCVRILDPGAGAGVLFASLVHRLLSEKRRPTAIEVVAYETDQAILPSLQKTMERCKTICEELKVPFTGTIKEEDFIAAAISATEDSLFTTPIKPFTHAILNPPYKKINGDTDTRAMLYSAGLEVANLYAAFAWLSIRMLEPGGQIVAITPRSFCNGPYFKKFREAFLKMLSLKRIHLFGARNKVFGDDNVLQENIIYYAIREDKKPRKVLISVSDNDDFDRPKQMRIAYDQVVKPDDRDAFIYLGFEERASSALEQIQFFKTSLDELNLNVSTGRTVDFRAKEYLYTSTREGCVPLIYPCHFQDGFIHWPSNSGKKPNAIMSLPETADLLLKQGYYVLVKRFSSKEQKRRVMAAVYDPSIIDTPFVSFENHLNYYHRQGKGLPEKLAKGLALYLNSSVVDEYFRLFSGHTQVNATDLRKLPYPTQEQLLSLGNYVTDQMPPQQAIEKILQEGCLKRGQ